MLNRDITLVLHVQNDWLYYISLLDIPLVRQREWFKDSFDHLLAIAKSEHSPEAGVMLSSG